MYGHPIKNIVWQHTDQHDPQKPAVIVSRARRGVSRKAVVALALAGALGVGAAGFLAFGIGHIRGAAYASDEANRSIERAVTSARDEAQERIDVCWEATQTVAEQVERLARLSESIAAADEAGQRLMIIDSAMLSMAGQVAGAQTDVQVAIEACR